MKNLLIGIKSMSATIATVFAIAAFFVASAAQANSTVKINVGESITLSTAYQTTITCGIAAKPKCEYIRGNVYCGHNCESIAGQVFCASNPREKCSYIGGEVYCGSDCQYIAGNVYCTTGGAASPATPAKPSNR